MDPMHFVKRKIRTDTYEVHMLPSDPRLFDIVDSLSILEENQQNGYFKLYFPREFLPFVSADIALTNLLIRGNNCMTKRFQVSKHCHKSFESTSRHSNDYDYKLAQSKDQPNFGKLDEYHNQGISLIHGIHQSKDRPALIEKSDKFEEERRIAEIRRLNLYETQVNDDTVTGSFEMGTHCPCGCTTPLPSQCQGLDTVSLWKVCQYLENEGNVPLDYATLDRIINSTAEVGYAPPQMPIQEAFKLRPESTSNPDPHASVTTTTFTTTTTTTTSSERQHLKRSVPESAPSTSTFPNLELSYVPKMSKLDENKHDHNEVSRRYATRNLAKPPAPKINHNPSVKPNLQSNDQVSFVEAKKGKKKAVYQYPFTFAHFYEKDERYMRTHFSNATKNPMRTFHFIMESLRRRAMLETHYMVGEVEVELRKTKSGIKIDMLHTESWTRRLNTLLKDSKGVVPRLFGINQWYTYFGGHGNGTGIHLEDYLLNSLNLILAGDPKIWTFIPPHYMERTRTRIKHYKLDYELKMQDYAYECIDHRNQVIDPELLKLLGIHSTTTTQNAGEMVITLSGTYHQVYNAGKNVAISINFASMDYFHHIQKLHESGNIDKILKCKSPECRDKQKGNDKQIIGNTVKRNLIKLFQQNPKHPDMQRLQSEIFDYDAREERWKIKQVNPSIIALLGDTKHKSVCDDSSFPEGQYAITYHDKRFKLSYEAFDGNRETVTFATFGELEVHFTNWNNASMNHQWEEIRIEIPENERHKPIQDYSSLMCVCSEWEPSLGKERQVYESTTKLKKHIVNANQTVRFRCKFPLDEEDNKLYKTKRGCMQHVWSAHFACKMSCPVCDSTFTTLDRFKKHLKLSKAGSCGYVAHEWSQGKLLGTQVDPKIVANEDWSDESDSGEEM